MPVCLKIVSKEGNSTNLTDATCALTVQNQSIIYSYIARLLQRSGLCIYPSLAYSGLYPLVSERLLLGGTSGYLTNPSKESGLRFQLPFCGAYGQRGITDALMGLQLPTPTSRQVLSLILLLGLSSTCF